MNHIKECLPDIKNRIAAQIVETEDQLVTFGDPLSGNGDSQVCEIYIYIYK